MNKKKTEITEHQESERSNHNNKMRKTVEKKTKNKIE